MQVKLSQAAQERVESLVRDGAYPSVEAAVEAAVAHLEHPDFDGIDLEELDRQARETRANGSARELDAAYEAELRAKVEAIVRQKSPR